MGKTAIGWTDETWNPIRGCTQVSPGCANCYAKHQAARIVRMNKGKPCKYDGLVRFTKRGEPTWTGRVAFDSETLAAPLRWRTPRRVFVNSMSDLFHESLTNEQIAAVFGVMAAAPRHTFQVLTKRAERMRAWFEWAGRLNLDDLQRLAIRAILGPGRCRVTRGTTWPLENVWLGVSVENQDAADERIPLLLQTPAAVRFLSCEPLLGRLDIAKWMPLVFRVGVAPNPDGTPFALPAHGGGPGLNWVISGCESGPLARAADDDWFEVIEEQCRAAGVPHFLKQQMVDGKLVHDFPGRQEFPR